MKDAGEAALFVILDGDQAVGEAAHLFFGGGHYGYVLGDADDGVDFSGSIRDRHKESAAGARAEPIDRRVSEGGRAGAGHGNEVLAELFEVVIGKQAAQSVERPGAIGRSERQDFRESVGIAEGVVRDAVFPHTEASEFFDTAKQGMRAQRTERSGGDGQPGQDGGDGSREGTIGENAARGQFPVREHESGRLRGVTRSAARARLRSFFAIHRLSAVPK